MGGGQAGKPTSRELIRQDIDCALREAYTMETFWKELQRRGYTVKRGPNVKHTAIRPAWGKKNIRLDSLGAGYTEAEIQSRLTAIRSGEVPPFEPTRPAQNVEECLRSDTARLMFANSEFLVLLNQVATDRAELAKLLKISSNMSRNAYTKLLAQLRSSGILTGQEYSAAYGGTMPAHEQAISWPHGNETTDFMLFLQKCGQQCDHAIESGNYSSDEERRNCELLTSVYSKLNGIFQQIHSAKTQAGPDTKASAQTRVYSDEFNRLYELLKQDKNYAERVLKKPGGNFDRRNPVRVQLMKEYLLSNDGLLEDYAKHTWISNAEHNARLVKWNAEHPNRKLNGFYDMPSDYTGYVNEFKHTLRYGSTEEIFNLCNDFENTFLSRKFVKTQRLTEEERFLFPDAANYERGHWQNFNEGMSSVENEIREEFDRAGFSLDIDREYQFYLNTENFSFSVKGGTEEENRLIESVINRNPGEGYVFNPLKTTIYALYFHRQPDLSFTPWRADHLSAGDMGNYGIANIPESYTKKMGQYLAAYRRSEMNRNLQYRFGFGIDDISYVNGHWQGSTDEITQMIEKMNQDGTWDKQIGDAYRNLMKEYTGTPVFQEPVFVFRNGEFHVTYEKPVIQENQ